MRRSRREAEDVRAGRRQASHVAPIDVAPSGSSAAAAYGLVHAQLARLRGVLDNDRTGGRSVAEVRRDHADLDRTLADAVGQAFAADAVDSPTPSGMSSWVAEGLARSRERELALFAAADNNGLLQATTAPCPRWGTVGAFEPRPSRRHTRTDTQEEESP